MADLLINVQELSGNLYPDVQVAQEAGLSVFADCLVSSLNELLDLGLLSVDGGVIIPAGAAADLIGIGRQLARVKRESVSQDEFD